MEFPNGQYPKEENLGRNCLYWSGAVLGCGFPKAEMQGRHSCEGMIDDVCLFLRIGRRPASLTEDQMRELNTRAPDLVDKFYIPPGDVV